MHPVRQSAVLIALACTLGLGLAGCGGGGGERPLATVIW